MNKKSGFTLIELMIVVAIIAIIAAIAIPNLLRSRMSANEAGAAGAMRTLSTGEASYQAASIDTNANGIGQYGDLTDLGGTTPPFIDSSLSAGAKGGYTYTVTATAGDGPSYVAIADPITPAQTGNKGYFVDVSGVIRFEPAGGATVTSPVLN